MSFEIDSLFHTESMVRILHAQGQTYIATQVCEKILSHQPENQKIRDLLEGLQKGNIQEKNSSPSLMEDEISGKFDDITEPGITFEALETPEEASLMAEALRNEAELKAKKLAILQELLWKVQERKNEVH